MSTSVFKTSPFRIEMAPENTPATRDKVYYFRSVVFRVRQSFYQVAIRGVSGLTLTPSTVPRLEIPYLRFLKKDSKFQEPPLKPCSTYRLLLRMVLNVCLRVPAMKTRSCYWWTKIILGVFCVHCIHSGKQLLLYKGWNMAD